MRPFEHLVVVDEYAWEKKEHHSWQSVVEDERGLLRDVREASGRKSKAWYVVPSTRNDLFVDNQDASGVFDPPSVVAYALARVLTLVLDTLASCLCAPCVLSSCASQGK